MITVRYRYLTIWLHAKAPDVYAVFVGFMIPKLSNKSGKYLICQRTKSIYSSDYNNGRFMNNNGFELRIFKCLALH